MNVNRPDKLTLDAYADTALELTNGNGVYNRFSNNLQTPILNAKGIQLTDASFVNSVLQLNDNGQLMFWYYSSANTGPLVRSLANLRCVRLLPSNFIAPAGYIAFTRNRYFNSVVELVAALNLAAATGGDDSTYNPFWEINANQRVSFSYDTNTRKVTLISPLAAASVVVVPAAADDPFVLQALQTGNGGGNRIRMNTFGGITLQPFVLGVSMNARIGFALSFNSVSLYRTGSWYPGAAATLAPGSYGTNIEADAPPILLGSQNVRVYMSIVGGSGMDTTTNRKNLIATIPITVAPLNIQSYSTPLEKPALSVPSEIYDVQIELLDDNGQAFIMYPNYNTTLSFSIYY